MSDIKALRNEIRETLLMEWDPIGIQDSPGANDEYNPYVGPILTLLLSRKSISELSNYLLELETKIMGLQGDKERARRVAEKLYRHVPR